MGGMAVDFDRMRENIASGIRRVTSDSGSTEMHSLAQQLDALKSLSGDAAAKSSKLGIRILRVRSGDALGQLHR